MLYVFFFKQKTAYEMRISDWSSDVCSSDLTRRFLRKRCGCCAISRRAALNRCSSATMTGRSPVRTRRSLSELCSKKGSAPSATLSAGRTMPYKPRADSTAHILSEKGWQRREVLYVGNTDRKSTRLKSSH